MAVIPSSLRFPSVVTHAMIFAAGLGTRMRPLSDHCPKVLLPCGGQPILWHHLDALRALGVPRILVNASYLADQIVEAVEGWREKELQQSWRTTPMVTVHREAEPLGTGGTVASLRAAIDADYVLAMNADCLFGPPYALDVLASLPGSIPDDGRPTDALALFVPLTQCHTEKTTGDAFITGEVATLRSGSLREAMPYDWLFSGVQWLRCDAMVAYAETTGRHFFSTVDAWKRDPESGKLTTVRARVTTAEFWDLGTPALYEQACVRWEGAGDARADR
jgi:molybdopterin-guanine dinucleotide biosynthesis protein A